MHTISVVIPAKNESASLEAVLGDIARYANPLEVIVVDDGSTDATAAIARAAGARVVSHPYSMGNGAAIKSGIRAARGSVVVFMDADGQHRPEDIPALLTRLESGYDMVVGSRNRQGQASMGRLAANTLYNRLASWMTGQRVEDLTSGFRAVKRELLDEFIHLLPNGFSYPTTLTMAFFRAGYAVCYEPITVLQRVGKSHIQPLRDGVRFLLIIFKIGTLHSPLKLFVPMSAAFFFLGLFYYMYTYISDGRFTNMGVLLFTTALLVFLIGLVSEQITNLYYMVRQQRGHDE